ncbi:hypothetical protein V6N13_103210 [Hibiscus sabdariffa]
MWSDFLGPYLARLRPYLLSDFLYIENLHFVSSQFLQSFESDYPSFYASTMFLNYTLPLTLILSDTATTLHTAALRPAALQTAAHPTVSQVFLGGSSYFSWLCDGWFCLEDGG